MNFCNHHNKAHNEMKLSRTKDILLSAHFPWLAKCTQIGYRFHQQNNLLIIKSPRSLIRDNHGMLGGISRQSTTASSGSFALTFAHFCNSVKVKMDSDSLKFLV